jgi:hypothetical protein
MLEICALILVIMGNPIAKRLPIISFLIRGKVHAHDLLHMANVPHRRSAQIVNRFISSSKLCVGYLFNHFVSVAHPD